MTPQHPGPFFKTDLLQRRIGGWYGGNRRVPQPSPAMPAAKNYCGKIVGATNVVKECVTTNVEKECVLTKCGKRMCANQMWERMCENVW